MSYFKHGLPFFYAWEVFITRIIVDAIIAIKLTDLVKEDAGIFNRARNAMTGLNVGIQVSSLFERRITEGTVEILSVLVWMESRVSTVEVVFTTLCSLACSLRIG